MTDPLLLAKFSQAELDSFVDRSTEMASQLIAAGMPFDEALNLAADVMTKIATSKVVSA